MLSVLGEGFKYLLNHKQLGISYSPRLTQNLTFFRQAKFYFYVLFPLNSGGQLLTVGENENHPRELKFGISINFSVYIKIPAKFFSCQLSSAVNSRQQLMTAVDS